jgi:hypothetical protein
MDTVGAARAPIGGRGAFRSLRPRAMLGAGIAASTIAAVSMADGGFFTDEWRWTGLAILCFVAVALLVTDDVKLGRVEIRALHALTALIAWTMFSAIWSSEPRSSVLETERGLVYLACLVAVLLVSDAVGVPNLVGGLLGGIVLVCTYSLADWVAAAPSLHRLPLLIGPIGYSNALGLLAAVGILLALGLAFSSTGPGRAVALLSLLVLAPTLVLTESRGAWLALVLGLATTAARFPRRSLPALRRTALALGGAAVVGFGLVWPVAGKSLATLSSADHRLQLWHAAWRDWLPRSSRRARSSARQEFRGTRQRRLRRRRRARAAGHASASRDRPSYPRQIQYCGFGSGVHKPGIACRLPGGPPAPPPPPGGAHGSHGAPARLGH